MHKTPAALSVGGSCISCRGVLILGKPGQRSGNRSSEGTDRPLEGPRCILRNPVNRPWAAPVGGDACRFAERRSQGRLAPRPTRRQAKPARCCPGEDDGNRPLSLLIGHRGRTVKTKRAISSAATVKTVVAAMIDRRSMPVRPNRRLDRQIRPTALRPPSPSVRTVISTAGRRCPTLLLLPAVAFVAAVAGGSKNTQPLASDATGHAVRAQRIGNSAMNLRHRASSSDQSSPKTAANCLSRSVGEGRCHAGLSAVDRM